MLPSTNTETHVLISVCTPQKAYPRFHDAILSTKYFDDESELAYFGYRYYSPELGRFISRDPMEEDGGLHQYGFVKNEPVSNWDRVGLVTGCPETGGTGSSPRSCCCRNDTYDSYEKCCCQDTKKIYDKVFAPDFKWTGTCEVGGLGWWFEGAVLTCDLISDVNYDCKKWVVGTRAIFFGFTWGADVAAYAFDATFTGAAGPEGFVGAARMNASGFAGGVGVGVAWIELGSARSSVEAGAEVGIDVPGFSILGGGSSVTRERELPCTRWDMEINIPADQPLFGDQ